MVSRGVKEGVQVSQWLKRGVRGVLGVKGGVQVSQGFMRGVRGVPGQSCKNVPTSWCLFFQAGAIFWSRHAEKKLLVAPMLQ